MNTVLVNIENLFKRFQLGGHQVHALRDVSLKIMSGSFMAISGSSGSGKTTLLNLVGGLDRPDAGKILLNGASIEDLSEDQLAEMRRDRIGYVFQTFNLLPVLTAFENVEYPLLLQDVPEEERRELCKVALQKVGLERKQDHTPAQLSGGQRQRVAIARALVKKPQLVLADEPTANLDAKTAVEILELMIQLNSQERLTFVFSSHDPLILKRAEHVVHLEDGKIVA